MSRISSGAINQLPFGLVMSGMEDIFLVIWMPSRPIPSLNPSTKMVPDWVNMYDCSMSRVRDSGLSTGFFFLGVSTSP